MARTTAQQLDAVDLAIKAIEEGAQSYTVLGRTFTKGTLATLYAERDKLVSRKARETRGGIKVQRGIAL